MNRTVFLIFCFISAVLICGCAVSKPFYIGKIVDDADIIALHTSKQKDVSWETFDVVLLFDYEVKEDTLLITGKGRLGDHYQAMYTHLRYFETYIFQVDRDGQVLDSRRLPTWRMRRPDDDFVFDIVLGLSPETAGISFGYSGDVYELERSDSFFMQFMNHTSFRKLP